MLKRDAAVLLLAALAIFSSLQVGECAQNTIHSLLTSARRVGIDAIGRVMTTFNLILPPYLPPYSVAQHSGPFSFRPAWHFEDLNDPLGDGKEQALPAPVVFDLNGDGRREVRSPRLEPLHITCTRRSMLLWVDSPCSAGDTKHLQSNAADRLLSSPSCMTRAPSRSQVIVATEDARLLVLDQPPPAERSATQWPRPTIVAEASLSPTRVRISRNRRAVAVTAGAQRDVAASASRMCFML